MDIWLADVGTIERSLIEGELEGFALGEPVGMTLGGSLRQTEGADVGNELSPNSGITELGTKLGTEDGSEVGTELGSEVGSELGVELGTEDGTELGIELGM
jgi:hypothetical protein